MKRDLSLNTKSIRYGTSRGGLGSLGSGRLQHGVYGDYGLTGTPSPQLAEAALADSLYRSVARQLQSGAGPAVLPQAPLSLSHHPLFCAGFSCIPWLGL